jgi:hypothetical protein
VGYFFVLFCPLLVIIRPAATTLTAYSLLLMIRALLPLLCLLLSVTVYAQDTLVLRNGHEHVVKVLEINPTEVIYKRFDNLEGPNIIVLKADVARILYANGTREEFDEEPPRAPVDKPVVVRTPETKSPRTDQQLYQQGRMDAIQHYRGNGAFFGTMAAALYPPAGVVTGVIVGAVPPNPARFYSPTPELLGHPAYLKGYKAQAHRRKIGKAATGFCIGLGSFLVYAFLVTAASQ